MQGQRDRLARNIDGIIRNRKPQGARKGVVEALRDEICASRETGGRGAGSLYRAMRRGSFARPGNATTMPRAGAAGDVDDTRRLFRKSRRALLHLFGEFAPEFRTQIQGAPRTALLGFRHFADRHLATARPGRAHEHALCVTTKACSRGSTDTVLDRRRTGRPDTIAFMPR